jgi:hypothetical protein
MNVQVWIEAAYNRSTENDPGKLAQDAELLDHANRVYQRLFALFAKARPDEAASRANLVLAGNPAFAALAPDLIAVVGVKNAVGAKVHVIPAHEIERLWHLAPSVYRLGNTLFSRGAVGDPIAGDLLTVVQLDAPATLATLATAIDARFPTRHHQVVIDQLACYLSTKDAGRDGGEHQKLLGECGQSLAAFATEYELPPSALEWAHAAHSRGDGNAGNDG